MAAAQAVEPCTWCAAVVGASCLTATLCTPSAVAAYGEGDGVVVPADTRFAAGTLLQPVASAAGEKPSAAAAAAHADYGVHVASKHGFPLRT